MVDFKLNWRIFLYHGILIAAGVALVGCGCLADWPVATETLAAPTVAPESQEPTEPPSGTRIGDAVAGTYPVNHQGFIGYLDLNDGHYTFTPQGEIPEGAIERFCFVRHPEGQYSVSYEDPVSPDTFLEDLEGSEYFASISFSADGSDVTGIRYDREKGVLFVRWDRFLLQNQQGSREVCLHSTECEFQPWRVCKPWD